MKLFKYDVYRYYGKYTETMKERIDRPNGLKYMNVYRKCNSSKGIRKKIYKIKLKKMQKKTFIQIPHTVRIGKGFYIGHEGNIIINPNVIIGNNVNIAIGVTIGQENRGKRKGSPVIGNNVWIGTNAVIVGKINVGDNVLIAPLTYVNFDVPSNSIVIGNPGKIIKKENATKGYINNAV